ncbi:hypothetical protein BKA62DRAFT_638767, partial [Auriculariales sp. MPI-PUGE-AT-0066]
HGASSCPPARSRLRDLEIVAQTWSNRPRRSARKVYVKKATNPSPSQPGFEFGQSPILRRLSQSPRIHARSRRTGQIFPEGTLRLNRERSAAGHSGEHLAPTSCSAGAGF